MLGSKLIEKLINDASISVNVENRHYHVLLNSEIPIFHICKDSHKINLTYHTFEVLEKAEEKAVNSLVDLEQQKDDVRVKELVSLFHLFFF